MTVNESQPEKVETSESVPAPQADENTVANAPESSAPEAPTKEQAPAQEAPAGAAPREQEPVEQAAKPEGTPAEPSDNSADDAAAPAGDSAPAEESSPAEQSEDAPAVEEPEPAHEQAPASTTEPEKVSPQAEAAKEDYSEGTPEPSDGAHGTAADANAAEASAESVDQETPTPQESTTEAAKPAEATEEASASEESKAKEAKGEKPAPKPRPRKRPTPHTQRTEDGHMIARDIDPKAIAEASKWGRIDDEGRIYVKESEGERELGQAAEGTTPEEVMGIYVRRYLDLRAQVALLEARLPKMHPRDAARSAKKLRNDLEEPEVVGDIDALRRRVELVSQRVEELREKFTKEREEQKAAAIAKRTEIVERAEAIDVTSKSAAKWKESSDTFATLLEEWKASQRAFRLDRKIEDQLWKRFSSARTAFERSRRQFFTELDARRAEVREKKEELIRLAEELSVSTDWGRTAGAYRDLMDRWKAAGRASRRDDDRLWKRFRDAQQRFFDARRDANAAIDKEYEANLAIKLEILEQAEKLDPTKDLTSAKATLRDLQDRWDEAGKVPRADIDRVEKRMRAVERKFREVEEENFRRNDPLKKARVQTMGNTFAEAVEKLEKQAEAARARGDEKRAKELEADAATKRSWLSGLQK